MLAKIAAVLLLTAAFGYALFLRGTRRPWPDAEGSAGWRRRFLWATLLFSCWLGSTPVRAEERETIMCYAMPSSPRSNPAPTDKIGPLVTAIQAAWLSLNGAREVELREVLQKAVAERQVSPGAARLLQIAFREASFHYYRARGEGSAMTCYSDPGPLYSSRETLLARMEMLARVKREGTLDPEVVAKAEETLAKEIAVFGAYEAFHRPPKGQPPYPAGSKTEQDQALRDQTIDLDEAAREAASALVALAAQAPQGWAEPPMAYRSPKQKETGADPTQPGIWQPPPP